ncbi:putative quinol monooxygenase [Parvularcula maris]|uniref:Antibiotic biosynthesis monooxygenase n=1 Tax=Parvularcula maris TaxID=2965077 RepID=A0A9X2LAM4_9PROT|nr:putative quinol monooxygenase [Parvularcula maris]MCQ8186132.1 antibiotic biosynthesis monooxygenase [Parvularcula maris]
MAGPLCILATITPRSEHLADARDAIVGIVERTCAEPGCQTFRLLEGPDGRLRLYEEWDDEAALEAHHAEDYTRAVFAAYEGWLATPPEIVHLQRLA